MITPMIGIVAFLVDDCFIIFGTNILATLLGMLCTMLLPICWVFLCLLSLMTLLC